MEYFGNYEEILQRPCISILCSEVAGLIGRLIGCFGLNGSSKQCFSLNQPSPKEQEKKREM